jgi:hypothetical protein
MMVGLTKNIEQLINGSGETLFGLDRNQGSQDAGAKKFGLVVDSFRPNGNRDGSI